VVATHALRAITTCVGSWYSRTLELAMPPNRQHFAECMVVTMPNDPVVPIARAAGVEVFETTAFVDHGAAFNKGYAPEQGLDVLGRHCWIAIIDADIVLPPYMPWMHFRSGYLHGCRRRILEDPEQFVPGFSWQRAVPTPDRYPVGYLGIFDAADRAIVDKRPWYDVSFARAGGGDAYFMGHWSHMRHKLLSMEVLHLGPRNRHWFGTSP
jgi:hypothetical protein